MVKRAIILLTIIALGLPSLPVSALEELPAGETPALQSEQAEPEVEQEEPSGGVTVDISQAEPESEHVPESTGVVNITTENLTMDDTPEPDPVLPVASGVVITELQTRGMGVATHELVEIFNVSNQQIDITGWCLQRASAAGNYADMACIKSSDGLAQTRVIWRERSHLLAISSALKEANAELKPDLVFNGGMSDDGGRVRLVDEAKNTIDLVGWGSASESKVRPAPKIPTTSPQKSLQRLIVSGEYQNLEDNSRDFYLEVAKTVFSSGAVFETTDYCTNIAGVQLAVPEGLWRLKDGSCVERQKINLCQDLRISEVAANASRQFVELENTSQEDVSLAGCVLMTNRSRTAKFELPDLFIGPGGLYVVEIADTNLKLTKSTSGTVYLLASDGETEVDEVYYEDLSSETSWSLVDGEWQQTYAITPGQKNSYLKYPACQDGYFRNEQTGRCNKNIEPVILMDCGEGRERNPLTGRCRNIPTLATLMPCKEGQYRSEETNRCRSIAAAVSALKPCADDQFRNPETNRCKKIASADELKECHEGYERNPKTNRCRKVLTASAESAPFAPEKVKAVAESTFGWWAFGGVSLLALGVGAWQWRFEAGRLFRKVAGIFASGPK